MGWYSMAQRLNKLIKEGPKKINGLGTKAKRLNGLVKGWP